MRLILGARGNAFRTVGSFFGRFKQRVSSAVDKNPLRSFYVSLIVLLLLIILSNILGESMPPESEAVLTPKEVNLYSIGATPRIEVLGKVEKSGVITISALTPGVVNWINKPVGSSVRKGEVVLSLASNYQGGNAASLQRRLAQVQYDNTQKTYDLQKELIKKQREIAETTDIQADEIRSITDQSLGETRSLIALNEEIITALDTSIVNLESTNVGGSNDQLILSTKQLKSQFLAGMNAARQGIRMSEYSASNDKAQARLSDLGKEVALKQLDLQDRMLEMNKEISGIQLKLARVAEAMMFPSAPFDGTIERVMVKRGQVVNPGTPLLMISGEGDKQSVMASVFVSAEMARSISQLEESVIHLSDTVTFSAHPDYVSKDAVQGNLYGVYYTIPEHYASSVDEGGFVRIELPVGYADSTGSVPFVPIDAVYQTKDKNFLFIAENNTAVSREVELGQMLGSLVEITNGLDAQSKVILNRTVISGDPITEIQK